jgi:hypothetical protein
MKLLTPAEIIALFAVLFAADQGAIVLAAAITLFLSVMAEICELAIWRLRG